MSLLTICPVCSRPVSSSAPQCPHCGEPDPGPRGLALEQAQRQAEQIQATEERKQRDAGLAAVKRANIGCFVKTAAVLAVLLFVEGGLVEYYGYVNAVFMSAAAGFIVAAVLLIVVEVIVS